MMTTRERYAFSSVTAVGISVKVLFNAMKLKSVAVGHTSLVEYLFSLTM